jgi:hypothetical protein
MKQTIGGLGSVDVVEPSRSWRPKKPTQITLITQIVADHSVQP